MTDQQRFTIAQQFNSCIAVFLAIFTGIFLLQLFAPFHQFAFTYLAMDTGMFLSKGYLWQPLTSIFLHGGLFHFILNMLWFYFFGSSIANAWRRREFIQYTLLCGIAASLFFYVFALFSPPVKGVGASGVVFGLMVAYAMIYGERTILAFFMIAIKAKYFVAICIAINVLMICLAPQAGVGYLAHLGGAVFGYIYLKISWWRQDHNRSISSTQKTAAGRIGNLEF